MLALKAIGRWISFFVFHMGILFFITTVSFMILLGNKDNVKTVFSEAEVYQDFVDSFLDTAAQESRGDENSLPYDDERFREIANSTFTPTALQNKTEQAIDSIYAWVDGSEETLSFELDFTRETTVFINDVSNYAAERFASLPPCSIEDSVNVTVFQIDCQPPGATPEIVRTAAFTDLSSTDFLQDPVISSENLFDSSEQTVEEQFSFLPSAYQLAQITPYIAVAVIVFAGLIYVLLHRAKRRGMKRLGRDMVTNALFILLLTVIFGFILPRYTDTFSVQGTGLSRLFNNVIDGFLNQLDTIVINIALVLGSIGISILAIEKMSRPENLYAGIEKKTGLSSSVPRKSKKTTPKTNKKPPVQTSEASKKSKTKRQKKKKYRKIGL